MQGQAAHFVKFAPEKIEYGIKRYTNETKRLYGVIEKALSDGRQWLAAGEYTIADMANFSWMFVHEMAGMTLHPALGSLVEVQTPFYFRPVVIHGRMHAMYFRLGYRQGCTNPICLS